MVLRRGVPTEVSQEANEKPAKSPRRRADPSSDRALHESLGDVLVQGKAALGMGEYRRIRVDLIERDPTQPRTDLPSKEMVIACREQGIEAVPQEFIPQMEALIGLAMTIKATGGLIQAIVVNNISNGDDERYVVKVGERRYLSHIYLDEPFIDAVVRPRGADKNGEEKHFHQLVENIQRQELTLAQRLRGIQQLSDYMVNQSSNGQLTVEDYEYMLGVKKTQAYLYRRIVRENDSQLMRAVEQGFLRTVEDAGEFLQVPAGERDEAFQRLSKGLPIKQQEVSTPSPVVVATPPAGQPSQSPSAPASRRETRADTRRGPKKKVVSLGVLANIKATKALIEMLHDSLTRDGVESAVDLEVIDWVVLEEMETAWRKLLQEWEQTYG